MTPYPVSEQVAKIGNSVVPIMAAAIAKANLAAECPPPPPAPDRPETKS